MTRPSRAALKHDFDAVLRVLTEDWNPVGAGGLPADEYESYVWPVLRRLYDGADEIALAQHLCSVELMYFSRETPADVLTPIARALLALNLEGRAT